MMSKYPLLGMTLIELQSLVKRLGMPGFAAKQIASWLYDKKVTSIDEMTNLSLKYRELLKQNYEVGAEAPVEEMRSVDGTVKYLYPVGENHFVESVYIPDDERATLCISSQVGCKMNCKFCMTGKQGYSANLTAHQIINQIHSLPERDKLTNVVMMGMGEPLDNLEEVLKALDILTGSYGYAWSPKRITVSTVGLRKGLRRFIDPGSYTITVSDESGVYAPFSTSVILTTDAMPAAYDAEKGAVVAAKGAAADDLAAYLKNVSKVTVNDTTYEATGKRGVKIIDPTTGEIHADAETRDGAVFTKSGTYKLTVEATGYTTPLTFEVEIEVTDSRADVDLDGRVDSTDVFYMMLYTANISAGNADFVLSEDAEKNKQMIAAADVDGNGSVDSTDAFYALYYVASKGAGVNVTWEDIIK